MATNEVKFKADDKKEMERICAKTGLESYCLNIKTTIEDNKNISESDCQMMKDYIDKVVEWIDSNENAGQNEFIKKQEEVASIHNSIISKVY